MVLILDLSKVKNIRHNKMWKLGLILPNNFIYYILSDY